MAQRISRKQIKRDEFVDGAAEVGQWMQRHWRQLAAAAVVLLILGALVVFALWKIERTRASARESLARGMQQYRQAEAEGFSDRAGLERALEAFDSSIALGGADEATRVAHYYRAATMYRLERHEEAILTLERLRDEGSTDALAGAAGSLLVRAYEKVDRHEDAIALLGELAEKDTPSLPRDQAWLELGRLLRRTGREEEARQVWQRILDEEPQSPAAREVRETLQPSVGAVPG